MLSVIAGEAALALSLINAVLLVVTFFEARKRLGKTDTKEDAAWKARVDHRIDAHEKRFDKLEDLNLGAALAKIETTMAHMSKVLEALQKKGGSCT